MTYEDEEILLYAFRYTLGRMTYCVNTMCNHIDKNFNKISEDTKRVMLRDILYEPSLGMEMDKDLWLKLANKLYESLTPIDQAYVRIQHKQHLHKLGIKCVN